MKCLMIAIGVIVMCASVSPVFAAKGDSNPTPSNEKIVALKAQMSDQRAQMKQLRAQDRVTKAVDKFCEEQDSVQYRICVDGPFSQAGQSSNTSTKR